MTTTKDKNLNIIETELKFVARQAQLIEGSGSEDYETVDEIGMAIQSALRALTEYKLSLEPVAEEFPSEIAMPEAA